MNTVCKSCNFFICCYPYEYFNQIMSSGFPLCSLCNNCMDCGNYICSCMRCCDCWLTMEICRCDNDPHCYTNMETSRFKEMINEIDNECMETELINSFGQQAYITDPIDDISDQLQQTEI